MPSLIIAFEFFRIEKLRYLISCFGNQVYVPNRDAINLIWNNNIWQESAFNMDIIKTDKT